MKQKKQDTTVDQTQGAARKRRFLATGEPAVFSGYDKKTLEPNDVMMAARADAANMSGGKVVRSGAFDSLDDAVKAKKGSR